MLKLSFKKNCNNFGKMYKHAKWSFAEKFNFDKKHFI